MIMEPLSSKEIGQLIEALQVWEKEPSGQALQRSMFGMVIAGIGARSEEESRERHDKAVRDSDRDLSAAKRDCELRREQSVLLQSRLLQMRHETLKSELSLDAEKKEA